MTLMLRLIQLVAAVLLLPPLVLAKPARHVAIPDSVKILAPLPSHLPANVTQAIAEERWPEARTGLEQLIANGDAEAKGLLGMMMLIGVDGNNPDIEQGKKLLETAALQNDTGAQRSLAQLYFLGGFTNGTPHYADAYKYVDPLATKRDPVGMYYASKYFLEGLLGVRNLDVGLQLLKDSALAGFRSAQYDLALLYRRGLPKSDPDPKLALYWFEHAARQNLANASYEAGMSYLLGLGTPVNMDKAIALLNSAGSLGNPDAAVTLAKLYQTGKGVPVNFDKAKELYGFAGQKRVGSAFAELSDMANDAKVGMPDPVQAYTYALTGALLGSSKAEEQVKKLRSALSVPQIADAEQRYETWKKNNSITEKQPRISTLVDTQ